MILKKVILSNYRGVNNTVEIKMDMFNCIVGQNDAGKSTVLKALDIFLNEETPSQADLNVLSTEPNFHIELQFDCQNKRYFLGESIETTIEAEELVNTENLLVLRKTWAINDERVGSPKASILRKKYEGQNDFIFTTEAKLMAFCNSNNISTTKGNGEEYNNVEKRSKIREFNRQNEIQFTYGYEDIPSSGQTKTKIMTDAIKKVLPSFQYFKADTSLSDTDTTIQRYFKDMATTVINEDVNTSEMEEKIKTKLGSVLSKITDKINSVVNASEKVEPKIDFDWSKLISTSFVSSTSGNTIPLTSRGDGFRRITMMSYFEYLAESKIDPNTKEIIFGFEEPETFLHPSAQENLFSKLVTLTEKGYQVIISTHSQTIVGNSKKESIIHISKPDNNYTVAQTGIDLKKLAIDLGIKPDNTFTPLFSSSKFLLLAEGIDDVIALKHNAHLYKRSGLIGKDFDELGVAIIPIGGCGAVKHWVNLQLFTQLEKPYFIYLDSDKTNGTELSVNAEILDSYGFQLDVNYKVTKKRNLENYIHHSVLMRLVPGCNLSYGDFDHVKNICASYPDGRLRGELGGKNVIEKHYKNLTIEDIQLTWKIGNSDEFLELYKLIQQQVEG